MKKLSLAIAASVMMLSLAGCGKSDSSVTTIRFLNFKPEIATVYEEIAEEYNKETGVKLVVETAAANGYESTLTAKMATSEAPTIFQINGIRGYQNWKDYCANLSGTKIEDILTDKSMTVSTDEGVFGIPYVVEGYGIIYNDEIMNRYFALDGKKSDLSSAEEIKSFEDLKVVVEDMTARKDELGIEGVFASTSLKPGEDWRWQTHLMNLPVYFEFEDAEGGSANADLDSFEFTYAENFRNIFDLYLNNSTVDKKLLGSKLVGDSMAEFAQGKCAMVQNGNWAWSQIAEVTGNVVSEDNVKMMPIYMGMEDEEHQGICTGTENFLCINQKASEEEQQAAQDFLYWLFSSETGKRYVTEELGFITPFNTFSEEDVSDDPLAQEVVRWMNKEDVETVPWYFTVFPSQTFKSNLGDNLLLYAQGSKEWDAVKAETVADWKKESEA
ncbi:MAG: ABC transporter substrate-binding protein [Clostridia bacterium]|nr:ABC transporter substrate-binding protein [Clostridia bacterium]